MIFTNDKWHGGSLKDVIKESFKNYDDITIASGYVSSNIVREFKKDIIKHCKSGGQFRLLAGMAFFEGLVQKKLDLLNEIHSEISNKRSGIYVPYDRKFHGKIYNFHDTKGDKSECYVGSANFSHSGLGTNRECSVLINNNEQLEEISHYLDLLFDSSVSIAIPSADIVVRGSRKEKEKLNPKELTDLKKHNKSIDLSKHPKLEISLSRAAKNTKSNLNAYFGKGRLNRNSGVVAPRNWYEVEIICDKTVNQNPLYPKGEFTAYTDDGYVIPMKTSGDYKKNFRSRGGLKILGQWIKGKLQKSGALLPFTLITEDTFEYHGKDTLELYKISDGEYYMRF